MSAPLLFIAADPRELSSWVSRWADVRPVRLAVNWARSGNWNGRPAVAIANGAGADRAFTAAIMAGDVSAVCNVGFCGALDETLEIGDVVVGTEIRDENHFYPASVPGGPMVKYGTVASIDHVAQTAAEKRDLRSTGASIVEMEAAGVARATEDLGLPFYCIRAVSDLANEDLANDFNAALTPEGEFSVARLVSGALASPQKRFGELLRLRERTAKASKNLGEFLADCSF
jgi:adenosylhomocysteine nucleosidase